MAKVPEIDAQLPTGMFAFEEGDSLFVWCSWCGDESRYQQKYVAVEGLIFDAKAHRSHCMFGYARGRSKI